MKSLKSIFIKFISISFLILGSGLLFSNYSFNNNLISNENVSEINLGGKSDSGFPVLDNVEVNSGSVTSNGFSFTTFFKNSALDIIPYRIEVLSNDSIIWDTGVKDKIKDDFGNEIVFVVDGLEASTHYDNLGFYVVSADTKERQGEEITPESGGDSIKTSRSILMFSTIILFYIFVALSFIVIIALIIDRFFLGGEDDYYGGSTSYGGGWSGGSSNYYDKPAKRKKEKKTRNKKGGGGYGGYGGGYGGGRSGGSSSGGIAGWL